MVEELDRVSSQRPVKTETFPLRSGAAEERISIELRREGGGVVRRRVVRQLGPGPGLGEEGGQGHEVRGVGGEEFVVRDGVSAQPEPVEGDPVGGVAGVHRGHHASEQAVLGLPQSEINIKIKSDTTTPLVYLAVTRLPIVSCIGMSSGRSL